MKVLQLQRKIGETDVKFAKFKLAMSSTEDAELTL
jgi:hypothetical protein